MKSLTSESKSFQSWNSRLSHSGGTTVPFQIQETFLNWFTVDLFVYLIRRIGLGSWKVGRLNWHQEAFTRCLTCWTKSSTFDQSSFSVSLPTWQRLGSIGITLTKPSEQLDVRLNSIRVDLRSGTAFDWGCKTAWTDQVNKICTRGFAICGPLRNFKNW